MIKPLCFYYPTTTIIVDDNRDFLENLPDNLDEQTRYQLFDSPVSALQFLKGLQETLPTPNEFLEPTDDLITGVSLNVNIGKIRARLYDKNRFNIPSIIVVDHAMPNISGLEFCQKLDGFHIKKIMLTGAGDHKLAIRAFNEGIIDHFITKDDPQIFSVLNQAISTLQKNYFSELSEYIIKNITAVTFSLLDRKIFQDFFTSFVNENNIVEYYLIDTIGSFFMRNINGELLSLVVQTEQEIKNFHEAAKDQNASPEIINALAHKEKLICLFSETDFNQPVDKWGHYLHKAHRMTDIEDCYYAVVRF